MPALGRSQCRVRSQGCTAKSYECRQKEVATACCLEDGDCLHGVPVRCGYECALKLPRFMEQCGGLLRKKSSAVFSKIVLTSKMCLDQVQPSCPAQFQLSTAPGPVPRLTVKGRPSSDRVQSLSSPSTSQRARTLLLDSYQSL